MGQGEGAAVPNFLREIFGGPRAAGPLSSFRNIVHCTSKLYIKPTYMALTHIYIDVASIGPHVLIIGAHLSSELPVAEKVVPSNMILLGLL